MKWPKSMQLIAKKMVSSNPGTRNWPKPKVVNVVLAVTYAIACVVIYLDVFVWRPG